MYINIIGWIFDKLGYVIKRKDNYEYISKALAKEDVQPVHSSVGIDAYAKWYEYIYELLKDKKEKLTCNLDIESKKTVESYILMNICLATTTPLSKFTLINQKKFIQNITPDVPYISIKEKGVYATNHGLNFIENVDLKLDGKDIIDCGAFDGQSATKLYENFNNSIHKIYCFEPDNINFELLKQSTVNNKNIVPVNAGVGEKTETKKMVMLGSQSSTVVRNDRKLSSRDVKIYSIDDYVEREKILPGFIKLDVEGLEYNAILGMKKVLEIYKPIVSISIYHNAKDFFEIKPLIESWNLGYEFKIRALNFYMQNKWFTNEFMLIGEVRNY